MTPSLGPAEVFQGDCAPLKAEDSGKNRGPHAAGRRPTGNASDRPAKTRRGSGAPLETKAGAGELRPLGRRPSHSGPVAHGSPSLEDGMAGLPREQEASDGIFQEYTVAVEGHCNKFCYVVVEPYKYGTLVTETVGWWMN